MSRVRSVRAWGPSTGPTACALAGWRCSLWGWRKDVPWGVAFHHCEGRLGSGAVPSPTARPLSGLLGSATHVPWAQVCGCGGPTLSPWPACPVGAACRGGGGGPSPGGVACHRYVGRLVAGAVPPPGRPSSGVGSLGSATRVSRVRSMRAWGPSTGPTACALAGWRCSLWGWRKGVPGGVLSTVVRGAWRQALSLPRPPVLWSGQSGFRVPCVPAAVGAGVGTQHRPHSVRPCGLALLAVWVAEGRPRGGVPSTIVRGAWCQALSLPKPPVLWSGQPGFRVPCVPGAVGAGVGTQHRPHSVRPCGPALLAVGVAEGRPRGGAVHRCEGRLVSGAVPPPAAGPLERAARVP